MKADTEGYEAKLLALPSRIPPLFIAIEENGSGSNAASTLPLLSISSLVGIAGTTDFFTSLGFIEFFSNILSRVYSIEVFSDIATLFSLRSLKDFIPDLAPAISIKSPSVIPVILISKSAF
ncbi:hypothetical protein D3C76_718110 [compost metagenome]